MIPAQQLILPEITDDLLRPGGLALTDRALALCALPAGARVLDVGCGMGATVKHLSERYHLCTFGVDASAQPLADGRKRYGALPLLLARGEQLPITDAQLDSVIAECSLSVMDDAAQALRECQRVLKASGVLILTDIYARSAEGAPVLRRLLPGVMTQQTITSLIQAQGFHLSTWEDHATTLKSIAACPTLQALWLRVPPGLDALDVQLALARAKLSYYLLIAHKGDARPWMTWTI
jgi:ubiquinone/menaquinone biosynthesis C-methylase UbiE